jgi:uncharacterized MAPEG superfamily protein
VIGLTLVLYTCTFLAVGAQRRRSGIESPATTGDAMLERARRVQQNTLEQLVVFVPSAWMFALLVSGWTAALLGLVWLAGRALYIRSYMAAPKSRGPAFVIAFLPQTILLAGAIIAAAVDMV